MRWFFVVFVGVAGVVVGAPLRVKMMERRAEARSTTVSVIIPCVPKHFPLLIPLLEAYQSQTVLPNEIVISLSESDRVPAAAYSALEKHPWNFRVELIKHSGKRNAGENRNIASRRATGYILMYQDADDLPHPQRVEIAKHIFENYPVDHLLHCWGRKEDPVKIYALQEWIPLHYSGYPEYEVKGGAIHNGNVCISRSVMKTVQWDTTFRIGEDIAFNKRVYRFFKTTAVVSLPLIVYRNELSSFTK